MNVPEQVRMLVYARIDIPVPITKISLHSSSANFVVNSPVSIRKGNWRMVHLPLPEGDWRHAKLTVKVTHGDVFDCYEDPAGIAPAVWTRLVPDITTPTGIRPRWFRYFEDDEYMMVYIFA